VTARHYARWIPGGDDEPLRRRPVEVYPDLLARLARHRTPKVTPL